MFHGSCLCGSVSFEAEKLLGPYVYCHCQSCRKSSGTAYAGNISCPVDLFKIVQGSESIKTYESSPGKIRHFCSSCGSPLFTKVGANPQHVRIRLGSLDTPFTENVSAHIFADHKAPWHQIQDDLPQYAEWPDATELGIPGSRQAKPDGSC